MCLHLTNLYNIPYCIIYYSFLIHAFILYTLYILYIKIHSFIKDSFTAQISNSNYNDDDDDDSYAPLFSSVTGYLINKFNPKLGVIAPFTICATPDRIGNLKSKTFALTFVFNNCSSANEVNTPSDTPSIVASTSSKDSPLARRYPTCLHHAFTYTYIYTVIHLFIHI